MRTFRTILLSVAWLCATSAAASELCEARSFYYCALPWQDVDPDANPCFVCKVTGAIDGDTVSLFRHSVPPFDRFDSVRVRGVDTPELRSRCAWEKKQALLAREAVRELLVNSSEVKLSDLDRDKFGRLLAYVWFDGKRLDLLLIKRGLGRSYEGGRRQPWPECL